MASFFKPRKNKSFDFPTRYYDPIEEKHKQRDEDLTPLQEKRQRQSNLKDKMRSHKNRIDYEHLRKQNRNRMVRVGIIAFLLLMMLYFVLTKVEIIEAINKQKKDAQNTEMPVPTEESTPTEEPASQTPTE